MKILLDPAAASLLSLGNGHQLHRKGTRTVNLISDLLLPAAGTVQLNVRVGIKKYQSSRSDSVLVL